MKKKQKIQRLQFDRNLKRPGEEEREDFQLGIHFD